MGDLSLGDFWGIEQAKPGFDDGGGISLVLQSSAKGAVMFEAVRDSFDWFATDLQSCAQPSLQGAVIPLGARAAFLSDLAAHAFPYLARKYLESPRWKRRLTALAARLGGKE